MRKLPMDYMFDLVDFLADWGVRGLCISGGGEPSLNEGAWTLPSYAVEKGMDAAFVTNAVYMPDILMENLLECRWVALSVDSATPETYHKVKGKPRFDKVVKNITDLALKRQRLGSKVDLCFKMVILPENSGEIYEACKMARELGVQDFHVRPVDFQRKDIEGHKALELNRKLVEEQFEKCHELETNDFHVYTVTHKFDEGFHVKHDFEKCLATPLIIPILTDGNAYLCVDKKMEAEYRLGSCYPNPENILTWWGSEAHRQMIERVNIDSCSRCTWSQYNAQMAEVVEQDGMCLSFP
jgi:MoaA/NifB/PqqE/SkfB family radical SAM enzyme